MTTVSAADECPTYSYRRARLDDVPGIVEVHYSCFTEETNTLTYFGRDFIEAIYRWLVASPICFTMVAEHGSEIVAFESACDRPYYGPMMLHNWRAALRAVFRQPAVLLAKPVRERLLLVPSRLVRRLAGKGLPDPFQGVRPASLVLMGVRPDHRTGFEIASQLLIRVRDEGRARGWKKVCGAIYRDNIAAIFLYKINGFRPVPELETEFWTFVAQDL